MYCEALWKEWTEKELKNYEIIKGKRTYKKKGYVHFDNKIWFPNFQKELEGLLKNGLKVYNTKTNKYNWHSFTPFLKILLKTPRYRYQEEEGLYDLETKIRPICFASHKDSLIYGYFAYALNKQYEKYINENGLDEAVLAYRSDTGKCNIQYSKEVFESIKTQYKLLGNCTAIALDIKGYFDNINHNILKEKWQKVINRSLPKDQLQLFKSITGYTYIGKYNFYKKYKIDERKLKIAKKFPNNLFELIPGKLINEKFEQLQKDRLFVTNPSDKDNEYYKGIPQGSAIALRTHSQTLSLGEGLKLNGVNFVNIIKGSIFMTNGKITELGVGQTYQPGIYYAAKGQISAADSGTFNGEVWRIANTSVSLYPVSQGDQREDVDTRKFCGVYRQITTYADQANKEAVGIQGVIDQQSGPYCAGRIFSQEGSCQKKRNKLRCPLRMIVCGNKRSHRYIISLFHQTSPLSSLNHHLMN